MLAWTARLGEFAVVMFAEISFWGHLLNIIIILLSLLMILVVLVQRGKGGGLAGAFGGAGGSSAFGSRAGDAFTKVTLYLALIWVLCIMIHVKLMPSRANIAATTPPAETQSQPEAPADSQ
jgi:preprotein translocase subunit SecG